MNLSDVFNTFTFGQSIWGLPQGVANLFGDIYKGIATGEITALTDLPTAVVNTIASGITSVSNVFDTVGSVLFSSLFVILPSGGGFPDEVHTAAQYLGNAIGKYDFIFPISDLFTILLLALSMHLVLSMYFAGMFIIKFVRGTS